MVGKSLTVAKHMEKEGVSIEVIDPRTIKPLDKETIIRSVKKTGKLLTLKGLFKDGADYVSVLTDYIKGEMARENAENDGLYDLEGDFAFKQIKPDQNFYINDKGELVICFDKYEVAAGAQGSPEFIIPNDIIKDIIK